MLGEIFIYSGFIAFVAGLILSFFVIVKGRNDLKLLHYNALKAGFVLLSLSFLLLMYYFISDDFSVYYVWLYTSRDMPLLYKFAAVWAGQQGTFLFWTWLGSISLLWISSKKNFLSKRTLLIAECVVLFLYFLTIATEPFKLMSQFPHLAGTAVTDGAGLDPELLSFWMVIHPPITFIAYAAMTVPFAASAAYLFWRQGDLMALAGKWARFSWLFFAIGVGITGGMWTYEAGWGLWTWDASMAGSLIPWLLLTAGLHRQKRHELRAALFMATFIAILFVSFIIRSGLWGSVHEFTETSMNYVLIFGILLITAVTIWLIFKNREKLNIRVSVDSLTPGVMVFLAAIVFTGLFIPLISRLSGDEASVGAEFYNLACYPFSLMLLILLGACLVDKHRVRLGIIVVISSIVLAFFKPSDAYLLINPASDFYQQSSALTRAYGSLSLLSMLPSVIFATGAVLLNFKKRPGAISLIHIGALLLFSGGIFAASFNSEYTLHYNVDDIGKTESFGDYEVKLSNIHVEQNKRGNWVQRVTIDVLQNKELIGKTTATYIRDKSGNYASSGIIRKPEKDIFVTFQGIEPVAGAQPLIPIHIRIYPMLNIFWLGHILLTLGISVLIVRKK